MGERERERERETERNSSFSSREKEHPEGAQKRAKCQRPQKESSRQ